MMTTRRRRRTGGPPVLALVLVGIAILAGVLGVRWMRSGEPAAPLESAAPVTPEDVPAGTLPEGEPLNLPELAESDSFVRDVFSALSAHPRLAAWLVNDDLVHRFVGAVVDLAGGNSPRERLDFMVPEGEFQVREEGETLVIDPASYRRYDLLANVFTSLDPAATARLYRQMLPLFEEAFAELGIRDRTFHQVMVRAMDNVLAAEVPVGPLEVRPYRTVFAYSEEALESRSGAQKLLIRMGPQNARRVQARLRQVRDALSVERPRG